MHMHALGRKLPPISTQEPSSVWNTSAGSKPAQVVTSLCLSTNSHLPTTAKIWQLSKFCKLCCGRAKINRVVEYLLHNPVVLQPHGVLLNNTAVQDLQQSRSRLDK